LIELKVSGPQRPIDGNFSLQANHISGQGPIIAGSARPERAGPGGEIPQKKLAPLGIQMPLQAVPEAVNVGYIAATTAIAYIFLRLLIYPYY
jgi:hypothetical protein